jgi:hypothetical protein
MKKCNTKISHHLLAGFIATAIFSSQTTAFADYASSIEAGTSPKVVTYDNAAGNGYPVISAILSVPGTYTVGLGSHTYTSWAFDATDGTGSMDIFGKIPAADSSFVPAVGEGVSLTGTYSPFDGIPEIETLTAISAQTPAAAVPAPIPITVAGLPGSQSIDGSSLLNNKVLANGLSSFLVSLSDVRITAGNGTNVNPFAAVFPSYTDVANSGFNTDTETYTVTDSGGNSAEMFDWVTSYSTDDLFGGTPVPTGPVNMTGFVDSFGEFVPMSITAANVPDASSTMALLGIGSTVCLGFVRRFKK